MKCPMTFGDPCPDRDEECRGGECMWYVYESDSLGHVVCEGCAVAMTIPTQGRLRGVRKATASVGQPKRG